MKAFLIAIFLSIIVSINAISATANCLSGKCEFINSYHYNSVTTYCLQTLTYENVETDYSFFTILETGEQCQVVEVKN